MIEFQIGSRGLTHAVAGGSLSLPCCKCKSAKTMPPFDGRVFQKMHTKICNEHGRSPFDSLDCNRQAGEPEPTKEKLKFMSAIESGLREWMLNPSSTPSHILGRTDFSDVAGFPSVSWKYLPQIDATRDFQRESWQGSIVIQSWTMFVSLSEELWEAALNSHPTVLANSFIPARNKQVSLHETSKYPCTKQARPARCS